MLQSVRRSLHRGRARAVAGLLALAGLAAGAGVAQAKGSRGERKPPVAPVDLRAAPIPDRPTVLPVALTAERSLVLTLPAGFWMRCPRHLPVPNALAGDGVIVQYLNARGGSVSMLYVGSVPLVEGADAAEPVEARATRTASAFAADLARHYARVDWSLPEGAPALEPATIAVGKRKTPAWRTARYRTQPLAYAGPESVFTGECVLFRPDGADVLAYVALDFKGGGTTLDAVLARVDVRSPKEVAAAGRRLQLNDDAQGADPARFAVRLLAFDLPAGFAPTAAVYAEKGDRVYVEHRLDATGAVAAVLRVDQRLVDPERTLRQECEDEMAARSADGTVPCEEVPLLTRGHVAHLFAHPAAGRDAGARAHTALLRLDDLVLSVTVTSRDAASVEADRAALVALLRTVEMAVRW
jgi:hypothetical protein